jgi:hypothetical protein
MDSIVFCLPVEFIHWEGSPNMKSERKNKVSMVVQAYTPSTQDADAGGSHVLGHLGCIQAQPELYNLAI